MRIDYFRKCISKDAAYYDEHNPNEMSANIARQIQAVQKGTGDKLGLIIYGFMGFFLGLVVAFWWGWLLACILMAILPFMGAVGAIFGSMQEVGIKDTMKAYSQSAGYAEQALSAVKIVHTYGAESLEIKNYDKYLDRAKVIGKKLACKKAFGNSAINMMFFMFYGYAFYFGGYLRYKDIKNGD